VTYLDEQIHVLIVDDTAETRANLSKLLLFDEQVAVVGEAGDGSEAIEMARELQPDVILMDINMPVMDGISATEQLSVDLPQTGIIILSVQGEQEYLRKAMAAGAREYLIKPPAIDDLTRTIHQVYELQQKRKLSRAEAEEPVARPGEIVTLFSTKGGVGKSTIAVNIGVALAQSGKKAVIVDLNLQFGDVAMLLNLTPRRTIADVAGEADLSKTMIPDGYIMTHASGLRVLPAPLRPEYAEMVTAAQIGQILHVLQTQYEYIIVDTRPVFDDITLAALDQSGLILLVANLDVLTIKSLKLGLEVMASLHYESAKLKLVLNQATLEAGIAPHDLESSLQFPVGYRLPCDPKTALAAVNKGIPIVSGEPKTPLGEGLTKLARFLAGNTEPLKTKPARKSWLNFIGR
jgi:pilus assembly protein CpaE